MLAMVALRVARIEDVALAVKSQAPVSELRSSWEWVALRRSGGVGGCTIGCCGCPPSPLSLMAAVPPLAPSIEAPEGRPAVSSPGPEPGSPGAVGAARGACIALLITSAVTEAARTRAHPDILLGTARWPRARTVSSSTVTRSPKYSVGKMASLASSTSWMSSLLSARELLERAMPQRPSTVSTSCTLSSSLVKSPLNTWTLLRYHSDLSEMRSRVDPSKMYMSCRPATVM
mmetsp:Transcript_13094/g.39507  ORF Transcript_13094/g.39507 Transcript_13094/m.39507 type:complete len:231 (-) Transcript_13094:826-1518(-)